MRKAIARHLLQDDALSALMNGPIKTKLGSTIPASVTWGGNHLSCDNQLILLLCRMVVL